MKPSKANPFFVAASATLFVSLIWAVLAWRTPTSTFHFAPLIAAAIGPYAAKSTAGPAALRDASRVAIVSLATVTVAVAVLAVADRMRGPTFWSADGAAIEAALFAIIGSLAGLVYLTVGHRPATATFTD